MSRLFTFLCLSLLFNLAQAQLPTPEYKKGQAILSGTIANYNPDPEHFQIRGIPA